jgi:4-amino-4-deoxy-L-arabinose transferase-like glycosyltransferase
MSRPERSANGWLAWLLATALLALALRAVFPVADPPWLAPIGITWHDEGVWAHNARNKALFGQWRLDQWNPLFVSPVFTGLEYLSFSIFGVGLWQARVVSMAAGVVAVVAVAAGLRATAAPGVALAGALLLAVNFTWVMYSRAALLEATMISALVASWACYARAERRWRWGIGAALFGLLAFFTKASAAFFLIALGLDACWVGWRAWRSRSRGQMPVSMGGAVATFAMLGGGTLIALMIFVIPHWAEYSFYNLFVYGSRRSSMGIGPLLDRASWFPVIHGFFARQWLLSVVSLFGLAAVLVRYRRAGAGERVLVLWFLLGTIELVLHDLGNERRYVFLIPPMVCLSALLLVRDRRLVPEEVGRWSRARAGWALPLLSAGLYVALGSLTRQFLMPDIRMSVRVAALAAVAVAAVVVVGWTRLGPVLARTTWSLRRGVAVLAVMVAVDLGLSAQWAVHRTSKNHEASLAVGRLLPAGTLVQGKLANGLALDNRIRPLFIGPEFGNYAERLSRPDVAWILTYSRPRLGYEGVVVRDMLATMPGWIPVAEFPVAETRSGNDSAILVRKPR